MAGRRLCRRRLGSERVGRAFRLPHLGRQRVGPVAAAVAVTGVAAATALAAARPALRDRSWRRARSGRTRPPRPSSPSGGGWAFRCPARPLPTRLTARLPAVAGPVGALPRSLWRAAAGVGEQGGRPPPPRRAVVVARRPVGGPLPARLSTARPLVRGCRQVLQTGRTSQMCRAWEVAVQAAPCYRCKTPRRVGGLRRRGCSPCFPYSWRRLSGRWTSRRGCPWDHRRPGSPAYLLDRCRRHKAGTAGSCCLRAPRRSLARRRLRR